jgi:hypothetical protein
MTHCTERLVLFNIAIEPTDSFLCYAVQTGHEGILLIYSNAMNELDS